MPSRQTHTKSRHGCMECKARKVKCDETRPSCGKCTRRKEQCHYKDTITPGFSPEPPSATQSQGSNTPRLPTTLFGVSANSHLNEDPAASIGRLPNPDLELLHHFTISTSLDLSTSRTIQETWQILAPQEAFSHPFLMHGILTVSALHISQLRPHVAAEYHKLAIEHYTSALSLFRPALNEIRTDNAVAAFLLSGLLVCISSAMPRDPPQEVALPFEMSDSLKYLFDMFHLQRGVKQVLGEGWSSVKDGVLAPLLKFDFNDPEIPLPSDDEAALNIIEERINTEFETESRREIYTDAVFELRRCFPVENIKTDKQSLIFAWPVIVSGEFFQEMVERKPMALAIMCYYGTLMHAMKHVWWIADRGRELVSATSELLGPEWETLTKWAIARVGL